MCAVRMTGDENIEIFNYRFLSGNCMGWKRRGKRNVGNPTENNYRIITERQDIWYFYAITINILTT